MSEFIQEIDLEKQKKLKEIIQRLHKGEEIRTLKKDFSKLIHKTAPEEIAAMEQALISEGFPVEEVQRLCDVHVEVFRDGLKRVKTHHKLAGHPVHTFKEENKQIRKKIKALIQSARKLRKASPEVLKSFKALFNDFKEIEKHYTRKENQLFPVLEQKNFIGPSKVMWGKHDEIREQIKKIDALFERQEFNNVLTEVKKLAGKVKTMIFMEEKILFPTAMKKLTESEWARIRRGESEIGYSWIQPGDVWDAGIIERKNPPAESKLSGLIPLFEGLMTPEQIRLMLVNLPFDITFVDENDKVKFYSAAKERIFPRSPEIIGRDVRNCHPPKSVHIVERILESFKKKEKDVAEFWIPFNGQMVHIRYFAIYDEKGNYRGVLEITQNITEIQKISGSKTLLDWE